MNNTLRINVSGRRIVAEHRSGRWLLSLAGTDGKRRPLTDVLVPDDITSEKDLLRFLHDIYHEAAGPGHDQVVRIDNRVETKAKGMEQPTSASSLQPTCGAKRASGR